MTRREARTSPLSHLPRPFAIAHLTAWGSFSARSSGGQDHSSPSFHLVIQTFLSLPFHSGGANGFLARLISSFPHSYFSSFIFWITSSLHQINCVLVEMLETVSAVWLGMDKTPFPSVPQFMLSWHYLHFLFHYY